MVEDKQVLTKLFFANIYSTYDIRLDGDNTDGALGGPDIEW